MMKEDNQIWLVRIIEKQASEKQNEQGENVKGAYNNKWWQLSSTLKM